MTAAEPAAGHPDVDPRVALAAAARQAMDAVVRTQAADPALERAARLLEQAADLLGGDLRPTMPWTTRDDFRAGVAPYNPVIGAANPFAPPMQVRHEPDGSAVGEVTLQPIHEGPPGSVHGGVVALLLDQVLGHAVGVSGPRMTAELTVRFRRPTPYSTPLTLPARLVEVDGRRAVATGEVVADGVVTAEAVGTFLEPSPRVRQRWLATGD